MLFAVNGNSAVNGGLPSVDYVYSYSSLVFSRQDDISLSVSGTLIDSVTYTASVLQVGFSHIERVERIRQ